MQTSDILKFMSVEDLSQRYDGTVVEYDDKWVTVAGFEQRDDGIGIHCVDPAGHRTFDLFNWKRLNTERLPSRWYYRGNDNSAVFLSYIPARQWKRGYSQNNTRLFHPAGAMRFRAEWGKSFSEQVGKEVGNRWTDKEALAARMKFTDAILSEDFCLCSNGRLHYKEYEIGVWKTALLKIHLREEIFLDEMRDLGIMHLLATDKELKQVEQKPQNELEEEWIRELREKLKLEQLGNIRRQAQVNPVPEMQWANIDVEANP